MEDTIRATRELLKVSMAELGALLKVSAPSIASLERNERAGTAKTGNVKKALAAMGYERLPNIVPMLDEQQQAQLMRHLEHPHGLGGTNSVPDAQGTPEEALAAEVAAERINPRWSLFAAPRRLPRT